MNIMKDGIISLYLLIWKHMVHFGGDLNQATINKNNTPLFKHHFASQANGGGNPSLPNINEI